VVAGGKWKGNRESGRRNRKKRKKGIMGNKKNG
jgi:hypothetical protein